MRIGLAQPTIPILLHFATVALGGAVRVCYPERYLLWSDEHSVSFP
jgi:hypothetical protein